jgi:HEAT repeat protein
VGEDTSLSRLFDAKARGDRAYLIESLRLEPEHAGLAADSLANEGATEAIPNLTRLLGAADPNARIAAIKALERLGLPDQLKPRLLEIARTDEAGVRAWATSALGSYGDRDLTPFLVSLIDDPSWRVSSAAVLALRKQGDPLALERVREARRSLWRSPARFWLYRRLYTDVIRELSSLQAGKR